MKRLIAIALAAAVMVTSAPALVSASITVQNKKDIERYDAGKVVTVKDGNSKLSVKKAKDGSMTITAIKNTKSKTIKLVNARGTNITSLSPSAFKNAKKATTANLSKVQLKYLNKNQFKGSKIKTVKMDATKLKAGNINKSALKNSKVKNMTLICKSKSQYKKLVAKLKKSGGKNIKYTYQKYKK